MTEPLETPPASRMGVVHVVNTDSRFGAAISCYLESRGWQVRHVNDPREALERWRALAPELVVTDLEGSDIDGFELLASLSALPTRPGVLACVPSSAATRFDRAMLTELGIDAVLTRPCRLDAVERMLAALLRARVQPIPALLSSKAEAADLAPKQLRCGDPLTKPALSVKGVLS